MMLSPHIPPVYAVIVAGGKGLRMASDQRKQYMNLDGVPVMVHTIKPFVSFKGIEKVILVVPEDDIDFCTGEIVQKYGFDGQVNIVAGGKERQNSVMNGLKAVKQYVTDRAMVMIHDAVRPFVDHNLFERVLCAAAGHGAAVPAVPVVDTLKKGNGSGFVLQTDGTVDRRELYHVQTPQAFDLSLILNAHTHALENGLTGTDDASLVELLGERVAIVDGAKQNIKLTTKDDLFFADFLVSIGFREKH